MPTPYNWQDRKSALRRCQFSMHHSRPTGQLFSTLAGIIIKRSFGNDDILIHRVMTTRWDQHPCPPQAYTAGQDARQGQGQHRPWSSYSPGGNYQAYPQASPQMYRQPSIHPAARARPVSMTGVPLSNLSPYPRDKGSLQNQLQYQHRRSSVGYASRPSSSASPSRNSLQVARHGSPPIFAGQHGRSASLSGYNNATPPYPLLSNRRLSAPAIHPKFDHSRLPPRVNANILRKQTYLNPWKSNLDNWSTGFDYLAYLTDRRLALP